jgi:hypothetical protein
VLLADAVVGEEDRHVGGTVTLEGIHVRAYTRLARVEPEDLAVLPPCAHGATSPGGVRFAWRQRWGREA